ncbi:hypothetical protein [Sphingomonas sp. TZW2008]|uniref:hypothetical protein n=1 Tax=Sphingomonas sp. TZW2008 TaxID=1917973 RepID=UPI000A26B8EC|nr:hypothetical protein [Sphingomonas sp. TZW2008]
MTELALLDTDRTDSSDQKLSPDQHFFKEAWAIAIDLRSDLGLAEAVVWADAYLDEVRVRQDSIAVARWAVVISALDELARARVH